MSPPVISRKTSPLPMLSSSSLPTTPAAAATTIETAECNDRSEKKSRIRRFRFRKSASEINDDINNNKNKNNSSRKSKTGKQTTTTTTTTKLLLESRKPRISRWVLDEIQQVCDEQISSSIEIQALPRYHLIQTESSMTSLTSKSKSTNNNNNLDHMVSQAISIEGTLGEGGFSTVYAVKAQPSKSSTDSNLVTSTVQSGMPSKLALKQIRKHKRNRDEEDWIMAVFDLCSEAVMLAQLAAADATSSTTSNTPKCNNIVRILGICNNKSVSDAYRQQPEHGFFFVMESLSGGTLTAKLNEWKKQLKKESTGRFARVKQSTERLALFRPATRRLRSAATATSTAIASKSASDTEGNNLSMMGTSSTTVSGKANPLLSAPCIFQRLQDIALGIACAMKYIHAAPFQWVLRDLKPQNIGFDDNGVVKLFDFGMARPLDQTENAALGGTFRYMAPEALLGHRVTLTSDVYSFGLILYELVTLQAHPFETAGYFQRGKLVRKDAFFDEVVLGGWRPSLTDFLGDTSPSSPYRGLARLIAKCWDPSPRNRPSFTRVYALLQHIIADYHATATSSGLTTAATKNVTVQKKCISPHQLRSNSILSPDRNDSTGSASSSGSTRLHVPGASRILRNLRRQKQMKQEGTSERSLSVTVTSNSRSILTDIASEP